MPYKPTQKLSEAEEIDDDLQGYTMDFDTFPMELPTKQASVPGKDQIIIDFNQSPQQQYSKFSNHDISEKDTFYETFDRMQVTDFQMVDDLEETVRAQENNTELTTVVQQYKSLLNDDQQLKTSEKQVEEEDTRQIQQHSAQRQSQLEAMNRAKDAIRQKLGFGLFNEIYKFLHYHRSQTTTDEEAIFYEIKHRLGGDRVKLAEVFKLDGIVFNEILQRD